MKRYLKHIILFLTLLPMMTACVLDSDPTENCSDNEVVVSLSVSSRAVEGSQLGDGLPEDIKLWVYGQTEEDEYINLAYINKDRNIFIGRDLYGNPVESLEQVIENGKNYYKLHFYVVLNSENVTGTNVTIGETTTITQLKALTFSGIVQSTTVSGETTPKKDNQMIMYGYNSLTIGTQTNYELSIQVERAVAKLELFFAKEFENSSLYINSAKLTQIPTIGALISGTTLTTEYTGTRDLSTTETTINATLESSIQIGNFSQYEDSFHKLALSGGPYLLENPNGETWGADKNDYTYPETAKGGNNVYKLTVKYTLNGTEKEQEIYLPKIERNHLYKIYARVKDVSKSLELTCIAQDWTPDTESWNYTELVTVEHKMSWSSYSTVEGGDDNVIVVFEKEEVEEEEQIIPYLPVVYIPAATKEDYALCRFQITAPIGATWQASFETVEGTMGAFKFLDANDEPTDKIEGYVGPEATLKIITNSTSPTKTSKAKLRIVVVTWDKRTIRVRGLINKPDDVTMISDDEFTLIQSANN